MDKAIVNGKLLNACHKAVDRRATLSSLIILFPGYFYMMYNTIIVRGKTSYSGPGFVMQPISIGDIWPKFPPVPVEISDQGFSWETGKFPMTFGREGGIFQVLENLVIGDLIGTCTVKEIREALKTVDTRMESGEYLQRIPVCGHWFNGPLIKDALPLLPPTFEVRKTHLTHLLHFTGKEVDVFMCMLSPKMTEE